MNRLSSALALTTLGALVAACGGLSGDTKSFPELATLNGKLVNDNNSVQTVTDATPSGDVRVAVVWIGAVANSYNVAVDVAVKPVFPSEFQITLDAPPPDSTIATNKNAPAATDDQPPSSSSATPDQTSGSGGTNSSAGSAGGSGSGSAAAAHNAIAAANAMGKANGLRTQNLAQTSWPDGFGIAVGAVVAYQDLNGNGALDLVDASATKYDDRIIGANQTLLLVYVQGDVPNVVDFIDGAGRLPTKGYNLLRLQTCSTAFTGGSGDTNDTQCDSEMTWLSMDTSYELPLSNDPKFSQLMCRTDSGFDSGGSSGVSASGGASAGTSTDPSSGVETADASADEDGGDFMGDGGDSDGGAALDASADASADRDAAADSGVGPANGSYPSPTDPNLVCIDNGQEFYVDTCSAQQAAQQQPTGLCNSGVSSATTCAEQVINMPSPKPSNWPCPVQ